MSNTTRPSSQSNGVRLALLSNRFEGIARKMSNTLLRSSRSGVINMARDFSCCIVTREHELLAAAEGLPIHVLSGPDLMARSMLEFHPRIEQGDAFLHNSPYHGCSHPADHTILVPVVDAQGIHRYTVLAKAHQADCGNSQPTTYMGTARDIYEEGALIFPAVKVQTGYQDINDIIRMCRMRIRVPEQWYGDYLAMVGAARIGERELLALGEELGWDKLHAYEQDYFNYSEKRMVAAIRSMPEGRVTRTSIHDALPGMNEEGIPIRVDVSVLAEQGLIEVDLRHNPDCLPVGLNLSESCARTSAMVGVFNSIDHSVPKNAGSFRRLKVQLRENCIAGIPLHPTSCSAATTNIADRVANAVQSAIASLADGFGLAECGGVIPAGGGVVSGLDPVTGKPFVNQVIIGVTGGAGAPSADAWQLIGHVGNAGKMFIDSIELDELRQPLYIHQRRFLQDTEGAGKHVGASSLYSEFGPVGQNSINVAYGCDGAVNAAQGARGGLSGFKASQGKRGADGQTQVLPAWGQVTLQAHERVFSSSSGGGGYGPPHLRDPAKVAHEVAERWISADRAHVVYRVVLRQDGSLDAAQTATLRRALSADSPEAL
ncbi:N-methylhydantoinase B [Polaromonas sp. OV174]|uniref:hydantoinase B/oxoprolinase family protein n=1 Tax=Polaromonas sp. OV174 TaxID=1855300 RepID=UPI0008F2FC9E|nr:hydantoinase B/oxoprolinase family protein [Polaromonas sp. OV174]SFB78388.1 N-methylhydantoinase B [Polaromonas sp. OV174]